MAVCGGDPYSAGCPSRQLLDRIGDKWTVLVLGSLGGGPTRHRELARRIEGISPKMLAQTLRSLERDGLVRRTVFAQVPPRVDYELTALGRTLAEPVKALEAWASRYMPAVATARNTYDTRNVDA